jgi:hypothetical protein
MRIENDGRRAPETVAGARPLLRGAQVLDADTSPENMALDILPLSPREAGLCGVGVSP